MDWSKDGYLRGGVTLLIVLVGGCNERNDNASTPAMPPRVASKFDPSTASTIHGRVTWAGEVPSVPPLEVRSLIFAADGAREHWIEPNPNAPKIDAATQGVGNAVVFLRSVDPARSRPWHHGAVCIEQHQRRTRIRQGEAETIHGFVRLGDAVEMVSRDPIMHVLHAAGASYFSLAFPDPDAPRTRSLNQKGIVELSSGAGYFAMRGYLFVDDHPYYATTDAAGRFALEKVPPGRYEIVVWLPSWHEARRDREPETGVFTRLFFQPSVEKAQECVIGANSETLLDFTFSTKDFIHQKPNGAV